MTAYRYISAAALGAALLVAGPGVAGASHVGGTVPSTLRPPAGQVLVGDFFAKGVQVYTCAGSAWSPVAEPVASMIGWAGRPTDIHTVIHFRGPSWESTNDGSLVEGEVEARSDVPGSIPQLLLHSKGNRGDGVLGRVSYIQRLNTSGGVKPADPCTSGQTIGVKYQAEYRFFAPR